MKKAKVFTKAELYWILNNPEGLTDLELAKSLKRMKFEIIGVKKRYWSKRKHYQYKDYTPSEKKVKIKKEIVDVLEQNPSVKVEEIIKGLDVGAQMGKHKRKGEVVATVMTPSASELSDEARKTNSARKHNSAIFKPKG